MVSIGAVIGGGFRLFREQPVALAIWWGLATIVAAVLTLLTLSLQPRGALTANFWLMVVQVHLPFYLLSIVYGVAISAAAFRAVMRPDAHKAGFLRVGMDEARVFAMGALWFLAVVIGYLLMVALGVVLGRMIYAEGYGPSGLGMILLLLVLLAPVYGAMTWLHVRLSPVPPLLLLRRAFAVGEAWRVTKGQFWPLFAGYLVILLIVLAAYLAAAAIVAGPYWGALARGASLDGATGAMAGIGPLTVAGWFVNGAVSVLSYALWAGSVGTATYQLIGAEGMVDYAETFA